MPPAVFAAARVVTPTRDLTPGYLEIANGVITTVRAGTPRHRRATRFDGTLIPGLIDLQVNGAGVDFLALRNRGELRRAKKLLASGGVTAFLPTLISARLMEMARAIQRWAVFADEAGGPAVLGVHLEGPYLNPAFAGAHDRAVLRDPNPVECDAVLLGAARRGFVRMITLAPELPGALETIRMARAAGTLVALGHTAATMAEADAAFDAGATVVTHLFNAMRPIHHRDPGIVVAALRRPAVTVGVIADLVHLHPAILSLVIALKGWRRVALVSDAVAAGSGQGRRTGVLAGRRVVVTDAARFSNGTLAGTTLRLSDAVRHVTEVDITLREAVFMASAVPAAVVGRRDLGRLAPGARADFVALDSTLRPEATFAGGVEAFGR